MHWRMRHLDKRPRIVKTFDYATSGPSHSIQMISIIIHCCSFKEKRDYARMEDGYGHVMKMMRGSVCGKHVARRRLLRYPLDMCRRPHRQTRLDRKSHE